MNPSPPRVVYDCNIYVQAMINLAGPSGRCIGAARNKQTILFATAFILDEIRESYTKIPSKYGVTRQQSDELADEVATFATLITDVPIAFTYDRDPDDAHYVNLALAAKAKLIVSRDRDLLDLMDFSRPEAIAFQQQFPDLRILGPIEFLKQLPADNTAE